MRKTIVAAFVALLGMGAIAQTADEVVAKHIEAMGGKEKLATLNTLVREGAISIQGMDIPLTLSAEQGKGFRMDINVMGTAGYQIYTPTAGWSYMPFQGNSSVEELPAEKVKEGQDDLDIQGDLFNYAAKGHKVELAGKEKVDGNDCYKLVLTLSYGYQKTLMIDANTYYINKVITKATRNGAEETSEITYSNYKKTPEGFVFANSMVRSEGEVTFSKITVNGKLTDGLFKPAQ